jgi:hypothetical protein
VFVFEGAEDPSNLDSLEAMGRASTNSLARFVAVQGADHFSILAPVNARIAEQVLRDEGPSTNLVFAEEELNALFGR